MTAPLATLQKRAERAGETRLLGPLDPALTRDLAAAAARSPHSRWGVTIVDERGYAIGHGIARPAAADATSRSRQARPRRTARTNQHHRHRDPPAASWQRSRAPAPRPAAGNSPPGRPGTGTAPGP